MLYKTIPYECKVDLEKWQFEAYAAVKNNIDLMKERIKDGAFRKTIAERFPKNLIKVFWWHREPMGLPIHIEEDSTGLFTVSQVSQTRSNEEHMILMRDKVVDKMSIGYDVIKDQYDSEEKIRDLLELKLYEYSPCPIAANEDTTILQVKSLVEDLLSLGAYDMRNLLEGRDTEIKAVTSFADLPLAPRGRAWDAAAAEGRVRTWAGGPDKEDVDWPKYRKAFFWYDAEDQENFRSYKLAFADIIGGTLTAVPRGVFAAAAVMMGARGGVDIPEGDVAGVKAHIAKYYAKMRREFEDENIIAPWDKGLKEGRVLSTVNRRLIADAVAALQALLEATEPEKSTPSLEKPQLEGVDPIFQSILNEMQAYRNLVGV